MTKYYRSPTRINAEIVKKDKVISTADGDLQVKKGDYLIKDNFGRLHPCKPNLFKFLYEANND